MLTRVGCCDGFVRRVLAGFCGLLVGCVTGPGTPYTAMAAGDPVEPTLSATTDAQPWLAEWGPVDSNIPTPESVIGHVIGDGAVRYDQMERYLRKLAEASPLVTFTPYAMSHEGRTLFHLTITSQRNHARLAEVISDNAKLADPRTLTDEAEATRILDTLPGVAWLAYSIHGDELSSTDAAIEVAYLLAAGRSNAIEQLLSELVILIDPLQNPDGRERYLGQLQHLTGKVPNPDYQAMQHSGLWSAGRGNHYLFDLNRDWLMQVHPETRGRAAKILKWNPHLLVDSHEMGSLDTYLFDPPREPFNVSLSESNMKWRRSFSADQAKAFDRHGWSYYTQEWYEEWYPGYTNSWSNLLGSIALLYEQASVNGASIKQRSGQTLTYTEAVHHQLTSTMANIETLRINRRAVLADYLADRRWSVSQEGAGAEAFLVFPTADQALFDNFKTLLGRHGIEAEIAAKPFEAVELVDVWGTEFDNKMMPPGTLVVRAAQPHQRLLRAVLGFDPHMSDAFLNDERKDLENHRGTRIYDSTAWNLPMAYGLDTYLAGRIAEVVPGGGTAAEPALPEAEPGYGYIVDGSSRDVYRLAVRLMDLDCRIRVAQEPFNVGGRGYDSGSLLLRGHENGPELGSLIHKGLGDLDLIVRAVDTALCDAGPDLGGRRFKLLVQPRIAIASQWPMSSTSFGAIWHFLDVRTQVRVSPVSLQRIGRVDLRKYNVLILPNSWGTSGLDSLLDASARKKLRQWVEAGGTLIAVGNSAAFLASEKRGISSVRLKRDSLSELSIYEEALKRELSARTVKVDPNEVWGLADGGTTDQESHTEVENQTSSGKKRSGQDVAALKRVDQWQRLFSPNGAFLAAVVDPEHWLCFGVTASSSRVDGIPVMYFGRSALMSKYPVRTPVRLKGEDEIRISGLVWPEARKRLANSSYATVERVGFGQVILFASDPFFRGYLEGTGRMLLNAMIFGPGLGTSQAVPW